MNHPEVDLETKGRRKVGFGGVGGDEFTDNVNLIDARAPTRKLPFDLVCMYRFDGKYA
jgi:hypothetical protein